MMTKLECLLSTLLLVWLDLLGRAGADFTTSFDAVKAGSNLSLSWDAVPAQNYPLCVTALLIDRNKDGHTANEYRLNITKAANSNSFVWTGVPFPLRYVSSGMYQLELRSASWTSNDPPPLLAKSTFFSIGEQTATVNPAASPSPTLVDVKGGGGSSVNKPLAIGLGVAIGIPSIVALAVVSWCFRRRQRRAAHERRRRNRREFIIS